MRIPWLNSSEVRGITKGTETTKGTKKFEEADFELAIKTLTV